MNSATFQWECVLRPAVIRFIVIAMMLPVASCRLGARGKTKEAVSGRTLPGDASSGPSAIEADPESQVESNLLWSPDQRVAQARFHYLLGEMLLLRGDAQNGSTMLSSAYALDAMPLLGSRAIIAKAEAGMTEDAMKEAERLVLLYPKNNEAKVLYAQLLLRDGKFSKAAVQLESVIKSQPSDELPYAMLVEISARAGNRKKAKEVARKLTKVRPQSPTGWSMMARLSLLSGARKEMLTSAKRAYSIEASPDNAVLYALALELNGHSKEALRVYEVAYKSADSSEKLTRKLVELYRQVGNLEEALRVLSDIPRAAGNQPSVGLEIQRVAILWELKRDQEALVIMEQLSKDDQPSELVSTLLGYAYERVKRPDDALLAYASVTKDFSLFKAVGIRRVLILQAQGKLVEAESLLQSFIDQPDPGWEFFVLAAEVAASAGRLDDAIAKSKAGRERYPDQVRFVFLTGAYQEKAGKFQDAMESMRDLIKQEPANSAALNFLGFMMVEHGKDLQEARKLIERALEIRPEDGAYLDSLGWCYFKLGESKKAEELLLRAVKISPDEGVIMEHLGELALQRGQLDAAIGWFEKALQQKLEPRDRDRIQARLEEKRRRP